MSCHIISPITLEGDFTQTVAKIIRDTLKHLKKVLLTLEMVEFVNHQLTPELPNFTFSKNPQTNLKHQIYCILSQLSN